MDRQNDIGDEMFFIQRGDVAVMEVDEVTVATVLGPGQLFGEVCVLDYWLVAYMFNDFLGIDFWLQCRLVS